MTTYRVGIRICAEGPCQVEFREFVPVFHRWIQSGFVDGPLLDVADYSHVSNGPGILLAGFDANYSIETTAGVLSLVGYRKRPTGMSLQDTLIGHARRVIALCAELEADAMFRGRLRFRGGVVHVFSNDRLLAPNTDLTESEWRPVVQGLARALWGEADVSVERDQSDPRERFSMTLRSSRSPAVGEIQTTLLPSPPNGSA